MKNLSVKIKVLIFILCSFCFVVGIKTVVHNSIINSEAESNPNKTLLPESTNKEATVSESEKPLNGEISGDNLETAKNEDGQKGDSVVKETEVAKETEEDDNVKRAYLTFDDGPSENTKKVLDILDEYNVKATFFVVYIPGKDEVYKDIVKRGHTLALHTYTHEWDIYSSEEAYFNDLEKISDYVENLTGVKTNIIRFPGGSSNAKSKKYCKGIMTKLVKEVQERGYKYFDWNVSNGDAESIKPVPKKTLVSNVKKELGNNKNVYILMHDTDAKDTTIEALPEIIEELKSRNYEILPIDDTTKECHHRNLNN